MTVYGEQLCKQVSHAVFKAHFLFVTASTLTTCQHEAAGQCVDRLQTGEMHLNLLLWAAI